MRSVIITILLILPIAFSYNLRSRQYYEYSFETYRRQFHKEYSSVEEHMYRMQIFADNLDIIDSHNAEKHSYTLGINRFADLTSEEFKNIYLHTVINNKFNSQKSNDKNKSIRKSVPNNIDWSANGAVTRIKDQGYCGACWAFAAIGAIESANIIKHNKNITFSEQELIDCSSAYGNKGCGGGGVTSSFLYIKEHGICNDTNYPYSGMESYCSDFRSPILNLTSFRVSDRNERSLAMFVSTMPTAVSLDGAPFQLYSGGIYDGECSLKLSHSVLVVGYGEENGVRYWKAKNSWGEYWGEEGYFRIIKDDGSEYGRCGITLDATYPMIL